MIKLKSTGLDKVIPDLKQLFLGICLGMQLLCNTSEEGHTQGLNSFFMRLKENLRINKSTAMGWKYHKNLKGPLYEKIENFYSISQLLCACYQIYNFSYRLWFRI